MCNLEHDSFSGVLRHGYNMYMRWGGWGGGSKLYTLDHLDYIPWMI